MVTITEADRGTPLYDAALHAVDPNETRAYIPDWSGIRIIGPFAFMWAIFGGRKKPRIWSDLDPALPDSLIVYPSIRWIGNRLNTSADQR